jgi:serine/threonine protein kinase
MVETSRPYALMPLTTRIRSEPDFLNNHNPRIEKNGVVAHETNHIITIINDECRQVEEEETDEDKNDDNVDVIPNCSSMPLHDNDNKSDPNDGRSPPIPHVPKQPHLPHRKQMHKHPSGPTTNKWWQKYAIRKAVPYIEQDYHNIVKNSPFLTHHYQQQQCHVGHDETTTTIPLFHRSEIVTGACLGSGGFSDVYEIIGFQFDDHISKQLTYYQRQLRLETMTQAIDPWTGRGKLAIKYIREQLLTGNDGEQNTSHKFEIAASDLVMEATYLSALNHPHILSIRGLPFRGIQAYLDGQHDSYFLICTRLCETLEDRIYHKWNQQIQNDTTTTMTTIAQHHVVPTIHEKTQYAYQIANALQYLHQHRIVFRDLKPQNIGFSDEHVNDIVLFDFGLCRELPNDTSMTASSSSSDHLVYEMSGVGTRRYMAPEAVLQMKYNCKVDVYSFAMVYWEMLTHVKPYQKHSVVDHKLLVCRKGERPCFNTREWSQSIQDLLAHCWEENVTTRFSMNEVCYALENIIHEYECEKKQQPLKVLLSLDTPPSPRGVTSVDSSIVTHDETLSTDVNTYWYHPNRTVLESSADGSSYRPYDDMMDARKLKQSFSSSIPFPLSPVSRMTHKSNHGSDDLPAIRTYDNIIETSINCSKRYEKSAEDGSCSHDNSSSSSNDHDSRDTINTKRSTCVKRHGIHDETIEFDYGVEVVILENSY